MAGLVSKIGFGQVQALIAEIGSRQVMLPMIKKVLGSRKALDAMVAAALREIYQHGVYVEPMQIWSIAQQKILDAGYDPFADIKWIGLEDPPAFDCNNPDICVALSINLCTPEETLAFYLDWMKDGVKELVNALRRPKDPARVGLVRGAEFEPMTMRWVRLDLNANLHRPLSESEGRIAGLEVFATMAQHPRRFVLCGVHRERKDGDGWAKPISGGATFSVASKDRVNLMLLGDINVGRYRCVEVEIAGFHGSFIPTLID